MSDSFEMEILYPAIRSTNFLRGEARPSCVALNPSNDDEVHGARQLHASHAVDLHGVSSIFERQLAGCIQAGPTATAMLSSEKSVHAWLPVHHALAPHRLLLPPHTGIRSCSPEPHFARGSLDCPAESKVSDPQQSLSSFNRRSQKSVAALRALFFKSGDVDPHVWDCRHSGA